MTSLIAITLYGWIPFTLLIFAVMPPRRAVVTVYILGWLFLPHAGFAIDGLPNYTKLSATTLGVLLGTVLFCGKELSALRPRWVDLPMAVWTLCPIASSLSNDLGLYNGLSHAFSNIVMWGVPYLTGRVHFTRLEHARELAVGIVLGGLVYVPLCLWELKMSPQLHTQLYGFSPCGWGELSWGGYRPCVFMSCGLEVGLWMAMASTVGIWLWGSGSLRQLRGFNFGWLLLALIITTVLCKVVGSWFALVLGATVWFCLKRFGWRLPALALILVPVLYISTRTTGLWSGREAVSLIRTVINERRAASYEFRLVNEDMLTARALQRPLLGWGGFGRNRVANEQGGDISTTDGFWVIVLGTNGLLGLILLYTTLLLPMVLLVNRYPTVLWPTPTMAPTCVLAIVANLHAIDGLANALINPIYALALGAATGILVVQGQRGIIAQPSAAHKVDLTELTNSVNNYKYYMNLRCDGGHAADLDHREEAAVRLAALGRSLLEQGMVQEAKEAWRSALQRWAELAVDCPDDPEYRRSWIDGLNDAAWSLLVLSRPVASDVAQAVQLAEQTIELEPASATYWNTLGIAYFRAGDWKAAIHALERSVELSGEGTSFDFFFLAMAYWQSGDRRQARQWYMRAIAWMETNNPDHAHLRRFRVEADSVLELQSLSV
jgi:tetratricopeptide (TPR) repeat protein